MRQKLWDEKCVGTGKMNLHQPHSYLLTTLVIVKTAQSVHEAALIGMGEAVLRSRKKHGGDVDRVN